MNVQSRKVKRCEALRVRVDWHTSLDQRSDLLRITCANGELEVHRHIQVIGRTSGDRLPRHHDIQRESCSQRKNLLDARVRAIVAIAVSEAFHLYVASG